MEEEDGGGTGKRRQPAECDCDVVKKKLRTEGHHIENQDDMMAWLTSLDQETVSELSELLDSCSSSAEQFNFKVRFIEDPYTTPVIFQSSSAYVTINGNEESCGSSFSDSDSTVMASFDMGSFRVALRKLARELNVGDDGDAAEEEVGHGGWMESAYLEGIFVKSSSDSCCDLQGTTPAAPRPSSSDGGKWVEVVGEDMLGGAA